MTTKAELYFSWKDWRRYRFFYLLKKIWRLIFPREKKKGFDNRLFRVLQCPVSAQKLRWLPQAELPRVNSAISVRALCNSRGEWVQDVMTKAVTRDDEKILYKVKNDIVDLTKSGMVRLLWR